MKPHACLIAGPLNLDDLPDSPDTLGGSGFYAAAAAAPFAVSQLWCRAGALDNSLKRVITARHIDEAGIDYEGASNRWSPTGGWQQEGETLGELTPDSAADLTCALAIDLPPVEMERALDALNGLGEQVGHTLIVAPRAEHCQHDPGLLTLCCQRAGVLIMGATQAQTLTNCNDPLSAASALQQLGAKTVILTAAVLGGIACYQQKSCTWSSYPVAIKEATGISATFAGAFAGAIAEAGKCDWRSLKRSLAIASAVASICAQGIGPKKLLSTSRSDYSDRFNRLRRNNKY